MKRTAIQAAVATCMLMAGAGSLAGVPPFVITQRAVIAAAGVYAAITFVLPCLLELVIAIGDKGPSGEKSTRAGRKTEHPTQDES